MARRLKLLTSLSTAAMAGALALSGCGEGEGAEGEHAAKTGSHAAANAEGEGEGGESEGAGAVDLRTDDVAYLTQLTLVAGHLKAFDELYESGAFDYAAPHVKHPENELYAALVPAFKARGKKGFGDELNKLAAAYESRQGVDGAYDDTKAAIKAVAPPASTRTLLLAMSKVARTAGDEFDVAVEADGSISNVKEYQDAYGFLSAAKASLESASPKGDAEQAAVKDALGLIGGLLDQFDGWTPQLSDVKPSAIYGAAARIEIAGLGLEG